MPRLKSFFFFIMLFSGTIGTAQTKQQVQTIGTIEQQRIGKNIFTKGLGSGKNIIANMSDVNVPAKVMACVNCHNANGTGNPESGIFPSNITWFELTKPYGGKRKNGKTYPAYDERTLKRAITMGIDPGGNELNSAMPRYNMSLNDIDNLVAYLKTLGVKSVLPAGIPDTEIRIGVVLSARKNINPDYTETIKKTLNAFCDHVNKEGGIYGRQLVTELFFLNADGNNAGKLISFLNKKKCVALTGFGLGDQDSLSVYAGRVEIPAILTSNQQATPNGFNNPFVFYLYPSILAQGKSLVDFSEKLSHRQQKKAIIIYQNEPALKTIAQQVALHYTSVTGSTTAVLNVGKVNEEELTAVAITDNTPVFLIGSQINVNQLADELGKTGVHPFIFAIGNLSNCDLADLPEDYKARVYIAYTTWTTERSYAGLSLYQSLKDEYGLGNQFKSAQLDALAIMTTMEESFKRIGRDLTKEKILKTLEQFYDYGNGLTPHITYSVNQRVGSDHVYIIGYNEEHKDISLVNTMETNE